MFVVLAVTAASMAASMVTASAAAATEQELLTVNITSSQYYGCTRWKNPGSGNVPDPDYFEWNGQEYEFTLLYICGPDSRLGITDGLIMRFNTDSDGDGEQLPDSLLEVMTIDIDSTGLDLDLNAADGNWSSTYKLYEFHDLGLEGIPANDETITVSFKVPMDSLEGLSASPSASYDALNVSWTAYTDAAKYKVSWAEGQSPPTSYSNSMTVTGTSATLDSDDSVTRGRYYYVKVEALDSSDNTIPMADTGTATLILNGDSGGGEPLLQGEFPDGTHYQIKLRKYSCHVNHQWWEVPVVSAV